MVNDLFSSILKVVSFLLILWMFSCTKSPQTLSPKEYVKWVQNSDNGLLKIREFETLEFKAQYRPLEHIILLNNKRKKITEDLIEKELKEIDDNLQYFTFRIVNKRTNQSVLQVDNPTQNDYMRRIAYMSFDMQNDFQLIEGSDTLTCQNFHFVRNYELAPFIDFSLAFESSKTSEEGDKVLIYDDKLFDVGKLKFEILGKNLRKVPIIKSD